MSRLIDAELIQYEPMLSAKGNGMYEDVMVAYKSQIDGLPTIEERKKGKWRRLPMACYGGGTVIEYQCPFCGEQFIMPSNYCQECGADMRSEENEAS